MGKLSNVQLKMLLSEWKNSLLDGSFVSEFELSVLELRLTKFIDLHYSHIDEEVEEFLDPKGDHFGG